MCDIGDRYEDRRNPLLVRQRKPQSGSQYRFISAQLRSFVRAPAIVHLLFAILGCIRIVVFFLDPGYENKMVLIRMHAGSVAETN